MSLARSGSRINHYAIEELVARTNTASIYRATDLDSGRQIAIKIPHPVVEGDLLFYNRFCREREIGIRLDHPSIVKMFREDHATGFTSRWNGPKGSFSVRFWTRSLNCLGIAL
jgi:serine/threonine protein kinase